MNLYLLMEVDCIIHTPCAAEWVVIGNMMDGRVPLPSLPSGSQDPGLFIYLSAYLFIPSPTETLTL